MALATLSIDLVAKLASMQEGLDKALRMNERTAAQIDARWKTLSTGATALGAAIAGAFSAQAIVMFTRNTINALDALNDAKDATGATVENLSALEDVARRNSGTLDDVTGILVKFNGALKEADGKNGVSQALNAIGLSANELRQLDPAEALRQVAVALATFADDGNKARVVQELFGKSIRDAAPFLNDLAQAGALNATVTAQQAEQAERFNKQVAALQTSIGNLSRSLLSEAIPAMNTYLEKLGRVGKNLDIKTAEGDAIQKAQALERLTSSIAGLQELAVKDPGQADKFGRRIAELRAQLPEVSRAAFDANEKLKALLGQGETTRNAGGGRGFVNPDVVKPSLPGFLAPAGTTPATTAARPSFSVPQDLADVAARLEGTDVVKIARLNAEIAKLRELSTTTGGATYISEALANAEKELASLSSQAAPFGPEIDPAELEKRNALLRDFQGLLGSLPVFQVERLNGLQAELNRRYKEGAISQQAYAQGSAEVQAGLKAIEGATIDVAARIEDTLGNALGMALRGEFDGIAEAWQNMLLDMVAEAAKADLMALLKGGSGGNLGSLASAFLNFLPGFASGGDHKGGFRVVGERGPEMEFTGPSRILNANDTRRALSRGGGQQVVINVAAGVGRAEVYEAVQLGLRAAQADARMLVRGQQ